MPCSIMPHALSKVLAIGVLTATLAVHPAPKQVTLGNTRGAP
ncbi:MAG: hypothetical protein ACREN3_01985 [Gemmatimonadaceae bacterium]